MSHRIVFLDRATIAPQIRVRPRRMRDVGGVNRLTLDLAELEALRLAAARVTVPVTVTYSLARDLPLAFGQLKATGTRTFTPHR
jgi:hypothetical protein